MSPGKLGIPERSNVINFKCCASKQFIHYICVKCYGVYHKCCLPRFKNRLRLIKANKLVCCDDYASESDDEKDLLEKTVHELTEDSVIKNSYIEKMKAENKAFLEEAILREEEMCELIQKQKQIIQELNDYISCIKKRVDNKEHIESISIGIQTNKIVDKNVGIQTDMPTVTEEIMQNREIKSKGDRNQDFSNLSSTNTIQGDDTKRLSTIKENIIADNSKKPTKKQILLLADENDLNWQIRELLNPNMYDIISIKKPGASLHQVIENVEMLAKNFTLQDYVIITGGLNDILKKKTPSFSYMCKKLKLCTHTNVLFASIPYYKKHYMKDKHVFKFNAKMKEFLDKFDSYTEGCFKFVDVSNGKSTKWNRRAAASNIVNKVLLYKSSNKNLKFITISDLNEESLIFIDHVPHSENSSISFHLGPEELLPVPILNSVDDSLLDALQITPAAFSVSSNEIVPNREHFLYPRLSQMSQV